MELKTKLYNDLDTFLQIPKKEYELDNGRTAKGVFVSAKFADEIASTYRKLNNQRAYLSYANLRKDKDNEFKVFIDENFGSFYFNNYMNLIEKLDGNTALMFRFLYLCTYANYDNYLMIDRRPMLEKDFKNVLKLSKNLLTSTKNDMYKFNLLIKDDKGIRVNSLLHRRGHITDSFRKNSCRVFDDGVKSIYESSKTSEHKKLGNIICLLPYLNIHHNIIARNVNEEDITEIDPLNLSEIGKILGYGYDNTSLLKKFLKSITVNGTPLMANISHTNADIFVINPAIFYKGDNIDSLQEIIGYFSLNTSKKR